MECTQDDIPSPPTTCWQPPDKSFTKVIMKQGHGLVKPNEGATAVVQVEPLAGLYHMDEKVIGYPFQKEIEICIGESDAELAELFDICIESMKAGEVSEIQIPDVTLRKHLEDKLKFDRIPGDDADQEPVAKFKIELKSFNRVEEIWKLSADEKIDIAEHQKVKGTACFQNGRIMAAAKRYSKALKFLITVGNKQDLEELSETMQDKYSAMKCSCLLNLSACLLKMKRYDSVVMSCSDALNIDASNVKGFYRRGQAFTRLNEFDQAKQDYEQALKLEPQNKAVKEEMDFLMRRKKQHDEKFAKAMSKMFGGPINN